jgi:hypothetical protein
VKTHLPFLAKGASHADGQERYENFLEQKSLSVAALLNITTAMAQIQLPIGTPLDYLRQLAWDDTLAQDRFFAYCDPALLDQVKIPAAQASDSEAHKYTGSECYPLVCAYSFTSKLLTFR